MFKCNITKYVLITILTITIIMLTHTLVNLDNIMIVTFG